MKNLEFGEWDLEKRVIGFPEHPDPRNSFEKIRKFKTFHTIVPYFSGK